VFSAPDDQRLFAGAVLDMVKGVRAQAFFQIDLPGESDIRCYRAIHDKQVLRHFGDAGFGVSSKRDLRKQDLFKPVSKQNFIPGVMDFQQLCRILVSDDSEDHVNTKG